MQRRMVLGMNSSFLRPAWLAVVWLAFAQLPASGAPSVAPAAARGAVDFNRAIRPLFAQHCTACHGGVKAAGRLSFLYREKALAVGKSGAAAIVPGDPE